MDCFVFAHLRVGSVSAERAGQGEVSGVTRRAAMLGFETVKVGTGWVTSHPDCMDRLTKHYSHLIEG